MRSYLRCKPFGLCGLLMLLLSTCSVSTATTEYVTESKGHIVTHNGTDFFVTHNGQTRKVNRFDCDTILSRIDKKDIPELLQDASIRVHEFDNGDYGLTTHIHGEGGNVVAVIQYGVLIYSGILASKDWLKMVLGDLAYNGIHIRQAIQFIRSILVDTPNCF